MNMPLLNSLIDIPMEQWQQHGVKLLAASAGADGIIRSFIANVKGRRVYGYKNCKSNTYHIEPA